MEQAMIVLNLHELHILRVVHQALDEFHKVNRLILVLVQVENHRLRLFFINGLTQFSHYLDEVLRVNLAIAILIETIEHLYQLFFHRVLLHQFLDHKANELLEVHLAIVVIVNRFDVLVDLRFTNFLL